MVRWFSDISSIYCISLEMLSYEGQPGNCRIVIAQIVSFDGTFLTVDSIVQKCIIINWWAVANIFQCCNSWQHCSTMVAQLTVLSWELTAIVTVKYLLAASRKDLITLQSGHFCPDLQETSHHVLSPIGCFSSEMHTMPGWMIFNVHRLCWRNKSECANFLAWWVSVFHTLTFKGGTSQKKHPVQKYTMILNVHRICWKEWKCVCWFFGMVGVCCGALNACPANLYFNFLEHCCEDRRWNKCYLLSKINFNTYLGSGRSNQKN